MEEYIIYAMIAGFGIGLGLKIYKKLKPVVEDSLEDGQLTLDEAIEIAKETKEIIDDLKGLPSISAMKRMRKADLIDLCAEHGVTAEGTKQDLIDALNEKVK